MDLVENIDFVIKKWFSEVKRDDTSQWLHQIQVQLIWNPVRGLWMLLYYKTGGQVFLKERGMMRSKELQIDLYIFYIF